MPSAGDIITVPTSPGARIATTEVTSDSSTFTTTETQVMSVTAPLIDGHVYHVRANPGFQSNASGDNIRGSLREDTASGPELDGSVVPVNGSSTQKHPCLVEADYTATATGNKTFVVTGTRVSGSGTCRLEAAANRRSYLTVDHIGDA